MKIKIKNLLIIVAISSLILSACKYDEGPGISLRTKRVRISNEWIVTDYQVNGNTDNAIKSSFVHGDSLQLVLSINKTGKYEYNLQYTEAYQNSTAWNKYFVANQTGLVNLYYEYTKNSLFKLLTSHGAWSFGSKHSNIVFGAPDLSHAEGESRPLDCKIIMLKAKNLKIEFVNPSDQAKHTVTFEPRNKEAGLLK
ncbi:MAG: hypothetical protein PSX81_15955 [bacterium]|nr:hypothetical protein [bacterium]